jgi:hypothetical protein
MMHVAMGSLDPRGGRGVEAPLPHPHLASCQHQGTITTVYHTRISHYTMLRSQSKGYHNAQRRSERRCPACIIHGMVLRCSLLVMQVG